MPRPGHLSRRVRASSWVAGLNFRSSASLRVTLPQIQPQQPRRTEADVAAKANLDSTDHASHRQRRPPEKRGPGGTLPQIQPSNHARPKPTWPPKRTSTPPTTPATANVVRQRRGGLGEPSPRSNPATTPDRSRRGRLSEPRLHRPRQPPPTSSAREEGAWGNPPPDPTQQPRPTEADVAAPASPNDSSHGRPKPTWLPSRRGGLGEPSPRSMSGRRDSNSRRRAWEARTLPTELRPLTGRD